MTYEEKITLLLDILALYRAMYRESAKLTLESKEAGYIERTMDGSTYWGHFVDLDMPIEKMLDLVPASAWRPAMWSYYNGKS